MKTIFSSLIITFVLGLVDVNAQTNYSVYYLTIGNGHYYQKDNFEDLPEAVVSANIIANFFKDKAYANGITINSGPNAPLTRDAILSKFGELLNLINNENPPNPFVIIYYCGHGFSHDNLSYLYLIPGAYDNDINKSTSSYLDYNAITPYQFIYYLEESNIDYCLLLDCCRKRTDYRYTDSYGWDLVKNSPGNRAQTMRDENILQAYKNQIKRMVDYPVMLASEFDSVAYLYDIPDNLLAKKMSNNYTGNIGPICRRLLLSMNNLNKKLTCNGFIKQMTQGYSDEISPTPVFNYFIDSLNNSSILIQKR